MEKQVDALIIGGGPSGMAAAIWCADLGLSSVLIEEQDRLGGQLNWTFNPIRNYPGVETISSGQLISTLMKQINASKVELIKGKTIQRVDLREHTIELADGTRYQGRGVIIATGVRRRKLAVPGEVDLQGKGILTSGSLERSLVSGKRVVIIGGGDAALENAVILSDEAIQVTVVHRGAVFSARKEFITEASSRKNVGFMLGTRVLGFFGGSVLQGVTVQDIDSQKSRTLQTDFALIRIGVDPTTDLFAEQLGLSKSEYVSVNEKCLTSVPLVFAIGDVANNGAPTISTAVGMAAIAAKNLSLLLSQTQERRSC